MRVAVVGLGSAGCRHARLTMELGHEVIGYDPEARPDGISAAPSLEAALDGADAAIVASPSAMHAEHALAAIDAGLPTLVEKPLAVEAADARDVLTAAERSDRACGVAMNLRFHPGPLALKRLVEEGELGRVLFGRASYGYDLRRWRPGTDYRQSYSARAELGGGILADAIHEVDELLWLLGPADTVSAQLAKVSDLEIDVEDLALLELRFASGALGSLDLNFFEPRYRRSCLLAGSDAVAVWDWVRGTVEVSDGEGNVRELPAAAEPEEGYRAELEDFFAAAGGDGAPRTTIAEGLAAVEVVEAARRSSSEGRAVELRSG
jgi:predicted dehydrogenase